MKTVLLAFSVFFALLHASAFALDGTFTATESWVVTLRKTSTGARKTFRGTATGTLVVSDGVFSTIDKTGIAGFKDSGNEFTIEFDGENYTSVGDYPLDAVGGDAGGIVVIIHLNFFTIAIRPGAFDFNFIDPGTSNRFTSTGKSLSDLSGAGFANSSTQVTATSTSSLRSSTGAAEHAPRVTTPPKKHGVLLGDDTSFSVAATGSPAPTFQWRRDNVDIPEGGRFSGTTTAVLTITNAEAGDAGRYSVVVSNAKGSVTSAAASLLIGGRVSVEVDGSGTVSPDYDGKAFVLGKSLSMTAKPGAGQLFRNWTDDVGTVLSTVAKYPFVVAGNLTATAHFEVNRFIPAAGEYMGSFHEGATITRESAGNIEVNLAKSGAFTGKVVLGGITHRVRGQFDPDGNASTMAGTVAVTLHTDLAAEPATVGGYKIEGTVGTAAFSAHHAVGANVARNYTLLLRTTDESADVPQGIGYAILGVSAAGRVKAIGKLAEGTGISLAGPLLGGAAGDEFIVFNPSVHKGKGLLAGTVVFQNLPASACDGPVRWSRPARQNAIYPSAFSTDLALTGAIYNKPAAQQSALPFSSGTLELGTSVTEPVTLSPQSIAITGANLHKIKLKLATSSGGIKGSFLSPTSGKVLEFAGVLFQNAANPQAAGFFLEEGLSKPMSLTP